MQLPEVLCFDHLPIYCLLIYLFYKGQEKWTEMFQRSELKCFISFSFSFRQIHNMILQQQKYWIMTGRNIYVFSIRNLLNWIWEETPGLVWQPVTKVKLGNMNGNGWMDPRWQRRETFSFKLKPKPKSYYLIPPCVGRQHGNTLHQQTNIWPTFKTDVCKQLWKYFQRAESQLCLRFILRFKSMKI